ncbi:MAG: hypothetical protein FWG75_03410 [Cystobacterineae bacterium]|nr:hypothetical protein [Cystobacterineae bacterium]
MGRNVVKKQSVEGVGRREGGVGGEGSGRGEGSERGEGVTAYKGAFQNCIARRLEQLKRWNKQEDGKWIC